MKIRNLKEIEEFPPNQRAIDDFENIKKEIAHASLSTIDEGLPFTVECDASETTVSATLNQGGRPVAFLSRTLHSSELHYPAIEKEATAVIEAVRKWKHLLARQHFTIVTDQRSVAFMFDSRKRTKVKNNKIQSWRLELASFSYPIQYRPGKENIGPDALSRAFCGTICAPNLYSLHNNHCHPGVSRLLYYVRSKNLPFSVNEVKNVCSSCKICAEVKPRFFSKPQYSLIKATQPLERVSIDFKGPLPSRTRNIFLLVVIDEYSRFPFCFPCPNIQASTVIKCLNDLFSLCGVPGYIHSDNATAFKATALKEFLNSKGIATSHSSIYHPEGNSQVERTIGTVWQTVKLALKAHNLPINQWENVLPDVLHSLRSRLCTATNATIPSNLAVESWPNFIRDFTGGSKNENFV